MSLQKCPLKQSHKEIWFRFLYCTRLFALLGLNSVPFIMPKHPLPQKNLFGRLVKKRYQVLGEEYKHPKSHIFALIYVA